MYAILDKLISIDTQIENSTLEAVNYIKDYLESHNCSVELLYNQDKTRASLIAHIGSQKENCIVFSGHLDTVSCDESFYKNASLNMLEEDGKLYGRGACDMKGSIAVFLSMVPEIIKNGDSAYLVLTHDEEGVFGAIKQIASTPKYVDLLKKQKLCVVMEPTLLKAVVAHKGARIFDIEVVGKSGHSSNPSICIDATNEAIALYAKMFGNFNNKANIDGKNNNFVEPLSTITCGEFNSGEAVNTVSGRAKFSVLSRENPNTCFNDMFADIKNNFKSNAKINFEQRLHIPSFSSSYKGNITLEKDYVSYGTEAGFFEQMGLATIVCGAGSIEQAHSKNEYIEKSQMEAYKKVVMSFYDK